MPNGYGYTIRQPSGLTPAAWQVLAPGAQTRMADASSNPSSVSESRKFPLARRQFAVLFDTAREHGLPAIAQVDLGRRGHKHQASHDLAVMAAELLLVAERRRPSGPSGPAREDPPDAPVELWQFERVNGQMRPRARPVPTAERPPIRLL
jgi:hypothetical protein